jgi:transcription elongation factor GreA
LIACEYINRDCYKNDHLRPRLASEHFVTASTGSYEVNFVELKERQIMAEKQTILTEEGLKKIEQKLEQLKSVRRRDVAERIKQAIEFGDISENSEYEDAKNEQAFIEGEILTLEKMLRNAQLIDEQQIGTDIVTIGSTVQVKDLEFGDTIAYTVVGSAEADPSELRISNESPVGSAILGRKVGHVVEVHVPAGTLLYEIMAIKR